MIEFDISHAVFAFDDNLEKKDTFERMLSWIEENIGAQTEQRGFTSVVHRRGKGWEIVTRKRDSDSPPLSKRMKPYKVISWHLCIEDEQKAVMFALKFGLQ